MNGIVIFEKSGITDKIRIIKKEEIKYKNKTVAVYKLSKINKKINLKLIKKLKKDNIKKLAFQNGINPCDFERDFEVITREKIITDNINKVISKASKTLGIKKGTLVLALSVNENNIEILNKLKGITNRIKYIYLYCKNTEKANLYADKFYEETGVSVIVKNELKNDKSDILIYMGEEFESSDAGFIFDVTGKLKKEIKALSEIKINLPPELDKYKINNLIIAELFDINLSIMGFARKTLDTSD